MENPFQEQQAGSQRPTFLLVLCILTFIGSGWGILSNLFSVFTAGVMNNSMNIEQYMNAERELENGGASSFIAGFVNSSLDVLKVTAAHAREIAVIQLVLGVLSLVGAVLMFQLRRLGFYLYTAAQILSLLVLPYFAGFPFLVALTTVWLAFVSLAFIVMYAVNLKYLK